MGPINQSHSHARVAWLDRIGITASLGCAAHCLLTGLLFLALPGVFKVTHSLFSAEWIHWALALLVIPVAVISISKGFKTHRKPSTVLFGGLGLIFILAGLFAHPDPLETLWTVLGGVFLATAHFINLKGSLVLKSR